MKSYISAFFLAFSLAGTPLAALAVNESSPERDTRFFVASTKTFWQNSLGVRHVFEDGFTADLSDFQLRLAKLAGLKPIPVKRLTILPADEAADQAVESTGAKEGQLNPEARKGGLQRQLPTAQVPWGVSLLVGEAPAGGASVSVAVLDTGVDANHPDLKRRIKECKDFTHPRQPITDGCSDQNGHGTHVSGIIAADGGEDGKGIYGVAPSAFVKAYRVCGPKGSCWSDDIAVAIRTAADTGAQIINLSLGSDTYSSLIGDAVVYATSKGVLVVAAAGNDGPYPGSIDYPAALTDVLGVGALDAQQVTAEWSSRGLNADTEPYSVQEGDIELAAPGVNIESTFTNGGYAILSGTSMAAPHVAGLAALVWDFEAEHPNESARQALRASVVDLLPEGDDNSTGWGLPTFLQ